MPPSDSHILSQIFSQIVEKKRLFFIVTGIVLFAVVYFLPPWPDAVDPTGAHFTLSREGKGALAIFLLAATWWIFEVVPIGVTSLTIGVLQALFMIRDPSTAFRDFMDPSVLFIFGSIIIGLVFTKTGLTRRMAYKMLSIVGERTSMIYLGCFIMTGVLTHFMAHTAVAVTMFPLLMAIHSRMLLKKKIPALARGCLLAWPMWQVQAVSLPCWVRPEELWPWDFTRIS